MNTDTFCPLATGLTGRPAVGGFKNQLMIPVREQNRATLRALLLETTVTRRTVSIRKHIPQTGKEEPDWIRLSLPTWKKRHDLWWIHLIEYVALAIESCVDIDYNRTLGTIVIQSFDVNGGADGIRDTVEKICHLIDTDQLKISFTYHRGIEAKRGKLEGLTKSETLGWMALLEGLGFVAKRLLTRFL